MIDPLSTTLILILLLDLLVVAVRTSLLNARPHYLIDMREKHPQAVEFTLNMLERPRLRASLRLAVVLAHFAIAGMVWVFYERWQAVRTEGSVDLSLGFLVLFVAVSLVLLGEFAIEGWILRNPEKPALRLAPFGALLDFVFTPFSALFMAFLGYGSLQKNTIVVTEDDLKTWVEEGQKEGSLEIEERKMIASIFQFGETLTREIMIPRIDMLALEINTCLTDAVNSLANSGHSRVPVFEETGDNIVGLLYAKDLLRVKNHGDTPLSEMRDLLRPAYFVPEAKKVDELLNEMQSRHVHMAIVVDEYGGVAGLVTLEDIMEEIIGEIQDEYDQAEEMLYQQVSPDEYVFQGRIDLDDFNDVMDSHLPKETADTLGGFIYAQIGRVPGGGESVQTDGLVLTVEQVIGRRIRKVRARRLQPAEEREVESGDADR